MTCSSSGRAQRVRRRSPPSPRATANHLHHAEVQITFQPDKRQHYRLQDNFEGKKARTLFQWSLEKV